LISIRRDLDDLRERVANVSGFRKEIDHALERIAAIEKHLGIDKKMAAQRARGVAASVVTSGDVFNQIDNAPPVTENGSE
jgi:hypothetical protein